MKKLWLVPVLLISILVGCNDGRNGKLDTTKLEKVEPLGNVTEEQLKSTPISYKVSSLDEGLDSLPFELKIPKDIPFDADPLQISTIEDFKHDGKNIRVNFSTIAKKKTYVILLMITVHNFKVEYSGAWEDIKLSDGVVGNYNGNAITFVKDGIYYDISYNNKNISVEQHKKDIIKIANQML
ncbi:hypothetical protein [Fictibacillus barbaricus]|uniref:DUF4367 domain-containing protein n=1 Tax=Fictibacillus barbaricus TaxID=182136 RepID=A0ABS2ZC16_9BACL|nr:hypothetical protein [Fictibacillus barbaricus]MBN3545722.1 hypothetical protein [Fictibacillus barbaricus]GGB55575.1 hypothetical protein GCM10007199_21800 [Fictibacillus barbaricus]